MMINDTRIYSNKILPSSCWQLASHCDHEMMISSAIVYHKKKATTNNIFLFRLFIHSLPWNYWKRYRETSSKERGKQKKGQVNFPGAVLLLDTLTRQLFFLRVVVFTWFPSCGWFGKNVLFFVFLFYFLFFYKK